MLFLVYFGLPSSVCSLPAIVAAGLGLVDLRLRLPRRDLARLPPVRSHTQWEAAECLALTRWQRMTRVILPQAMRIATAPTVGFLVQIVKNTSLASASASSNLPGPARSSTTRSSSPSRYSAGRAAFTSPSASALAPGAAASKGNSMSAIVELAPMSQELRGPAGAEGVSLRGRRRGGGRHHRPQRFGQEHGASLHQRAGDDRRRPDRRLRPASDVAQAGSCRLRRDVGIVFQSYNLFPHLTVSENIMLAPASC